MKNWKFIKIGNAFDFETQAVVDRKEAVKKAEESLRKAESERNKHRGEMYWEEAFITAKKDLERAKENLERAQRQKTGNDATGPNWDKKRQLEDELRGWMTTASKATGEEKQNAEKQIADIRKELNDVKIKIAHGENKKAGNESIEKQEWSMFKGLSKDAEKKVGNADLPTEQDLKNWIRMSQQDMKDAQREMEKNKPLGHPDSYREENYGRAKVKYDEAEKAIKKMEEELRQGKYKKVGNESIGDEYNAEIQRLTKKAEQLRRMGQGRSAMEVEKQIEKLGKELRELGNKKTGNAGHWNSSKTMYAKWDDASGRPADEYAVITWLGEGKGGLVNIWKGHQMTSEKYGSYDLSDLRRWAEQRIGNETLAEYAKSKPRVINGLSRAQNAMTKNSQITLWNGNDSVLISENGLVQYLENNSFETDRAKYDSQEKAVEELTKKGYHKK